MGERLDRRLVAVMFTDMVGYTALMQADERPGGRQARPVHERARAPPRRVRRDDRPAARRRQHEHVPELARCGASRGCDAAGARRAGRSGSDRRPCRRGDRRARAAHRRRREHRRPDRVIRGAGRRDGVGHRVRRRSRTEATSASSRLGAVQAQERRAPVRALRGVGRRPRGAGPGGAGGQGRAVRQPAEQPAGPAPRRWSVGPRISRRSPSSCASIASSRSPARAASGRHASSSSSAGCSRRSSWTVSRSSRWPTSPTPRRFLPALAEALDVKEAEGRTLGDGIVALIGDKKALLLLDNLEQVVSAAPEVARLIERCPELRIVTTSRTPLRIAAEREYALAPLELPPSRIGLPSLCVSGTRCSSSARRRGAFELTPRTRRPSRPSAGDWTACRWRSSWPPPGCGSCRRRPCSSGSTTRSTCSRPARATFPSGSRRCAPRSTGATRSSTEPEQRLFRRMAVFAGGCTLEDVEAVCADPGESVLDELESLVDKALVQMDGQGDRLRMLQTIGEYARERLEAAGETREIALRHARRYAAARPGDPDGIEGADQIGVRWSAASPRKATSRPRSTRSSQRRGDGDAPRAKPACSCAATCGCTGTSAARTSPRASTRRRSSTPIPAALRRSGAPAHSSPPGWRRGCSARSSARTRNGPRPTASPQSSTPIASCASLRSSGRSR